jgi:hypothetical protein
MAAFSDDDDLGESLSEEEEEAHYYRATPLSYISPKSDDEEAGINQ